MRCPFCGFEKTKVVDKRLKNKGLINRRRRSCLSCTKRFTTFETLALNPIMVIKRDGSREGFNRKKIINGLVKAFEKRSVSIEVINNIVSRVESGFLESGVSEIKSVEIGLLILKELEKIDKIAYMRFASVYKNFDNIDSFSNELVELKKIGGGFK